MIAEGVTLNVVNFGAKPDGETDSTNALLSAWGTACSSTTPTTIYVPLGRFLVGKVVFKGRCNNKGITVRIDGTLVAPSNYDAIGNCGNWLYFDDVDGVAVIGGVLDGQGIGLWACKRSGKTCPTGATNLGFTNSNNIVINGVTSLNSQMFHIVIDGSCGPGHGISVGSLGKELEEAGVENVTVNTVTFAGTENGVRIKSWGKPSNGFARNILFQHVTMLVQNPIVIDQNYCPHEKNCANQVSGVEISNVMYQHIHGSSTKEVAVKMNCSPKHRCSGINLEDVMLTHQTKQAVCNTPHHSPHARKQERVLPAFFSH
ncbi:unnamed protein product [Sphenostylis stenocarpa]|uniref:Rhamnogalacturonase A/B/Epimerase-like pectate lyase domain-containing protein n=1 Tax=Sphenostylis stenocarpa TaxID=92480 RepID=A0AA86SCN1_9FABA|nr:unnamed protein product [Sphenostylis stenocarpa]